MTEQLIERLKAGVSEKLDADGCHHDHRYTIETLRELLREEQTDIERAIGDLRSQCGYCDCEVMFNVHA